MNNHFFKSTLSLYIAIILLAGLAPAPVALGCASCGCLLNSDWDIQGFYTEPGLKMDITLSLIDKASLRSGTGAFPRATFPTGRN